MKMTVVSAIYFNLCSCFVMFSQVIFIQQHKQIHPYKEKQKEGFREESLG